MSKLAIQGGSPAITHKWPEWPEHDEREVRVVADVISSGNWGGYPMPNKHTADFQRDFAAHHDCA